MLAKITCQNEACEDTFEVHYNYTPAQAGSRDEPSYPEYLEAESVLCPVCGEEMAQEAVEAQIWSYREDKKNGISY